MGSAGSAGLLPRGWGGKLSEGGCCLALIGGSPGFAPFGFQVVLGSFEHLAGLVPCLWGWFNVHIRVIDQFLRGGLIF